MNREVKKRKRCGEAAAAAPPVSERSHHSITAKGPSKGEIGRVIKVTVSEQLARDQGLDGSKEWSDPTIEQCEMESCRNPEYNLL
jgi:hypothetical protein